MVEIHIFVPLYRWMSRYYNNTGLHIKNNNFPLQKGKIKMHISYDLQAKGITRADFNRVARHKTCNIKFIGVAERQNKYE